MSTDLHRILLLTLALALGGPIACGPHDAHDDDHEEHDHGEEEPALDACEHAKDGPFADRTATAEAADAPQLDALHTAYTLSLPSGEGATRTGYVSFETSENAEIFFFVSEPDAQVALTTDGQPVEAEHEDEVDPDAHCVELSRGFGYELAAATSYTLAVTSEAEQVVVVPVEVGAAHE